MSDPFAPIAGGKRKPIGAPPIGTLIAPVPDDAPPPPSRHPKLGEPSARWTYSDAIGRLLGFVLRFEASGGKEFRPLTLWRPAAGVKPEWRWESWPPPRPLYGLHDLAQKQTAPVVVVEGEKAADAARQLLPSFAVVTTPNGSKGAHKADWTGLRGRTVTVWPDADTAGLEYARAVARAAMNAAAASVAIASPPPGVIVGWDAANALEDGWDAARANALIAGADTIRATAAEADGQSIGVRRRASQRDVLIGLTEFIELWHDASRTAHASFKVGAHHEHWPVRSGEFRRWWSCKFYEETGGAIGGQALEDGLRVLEARAVNIGPQYEWFVRTGHAGGSLYLDLGDPQWRAVEITAADWRLIETPPLKFLRAPSTRPLPLPEPGSLIEELRRFLNVKTDADFLLVIGWLVAALRHRGPFPILVVNGEAGTGKSVFSRIVRSLVDPSAAPIRAAPKDERDLVVWATNSWVLAFDNLSSMPGWLADALCRLASGSGFATRMLHTDRDEMIFDGARPIILNSIPTLTDRADLADRAVTVHLRTIPEDERRPEEELFAEFEHARPRILGALLDATSRALANIASVKLDRAPRMADAAKWITAAEPGLGWPAGEFLKIYAENRRDVSEAAFEADAVAVAIDKLIATERPSGFQGTATELLAAIDNMVPEAARKSKYWPQNASQLGNRVARATPLLRAKGYALERRHSGGRSITIIPPRLELQRTAGDSFVDDFIPLG
jgi:putative DNA primase/helicase